MMGYSQSGPIALAGVHSVESYCAVHGGRPVPQGYAYDSGSNTEFLTVEQLQQLIAEHVTHPEANLA